MSKQTRESHRPVDHREQPLLSRILARLLWSQPSDVGFDYVSAMSIDEAKKKELVAAFMLAEFNALVERARDIDAISASRINFFLIIVAAVSAGLGTAIEFLSSLPDPLSIVLLALVSILVLGMVTYYYSINSAVATVILYRTAGRIRCWFADLASDEDIPYFAYLPSDNRPRFSTSFWMFRGGEAVVTAVNAATIAGIVAILLYQYPVHPQLWGLVLAAVFAWLIAWVGQRLFFILRMRLEESQHEKPYYVHFTDEQYALKYTHPIRKEAKKL